MLWYLDRYQKTNIRLTKSLARQGLATCEAGARAGAVTDSGPVHVDYVCPHAWLYIACLQCQTFAQFLTGCLSQGLPGQGDLAGSICIYADEAQPGNVLRPDRGGASWQCIGASKKCQISSSPGGSGG